jgi:CBS domain-containing protein
MRDPDSIPVTEIMTREVHAVKGTTLLKQAAVELLDMGVSGLPVTDDDGRPVGILSLRDLLQAVRPGTPGHAADAPTVFYASLDAGQLRQLLPAFEHHELEGHVGEQMSSHVFTCTETESIREAARAMVGRGIHRLLVVDERGRLVGLVSSMDIVTYVAR